MCSARPFGGGLLSGAERSLCRGAPGARVRATGAASKERRGSASWTSIRRLTLRAFPLVAPLLEGRHPVLLDGQPCANTARGAGGEAEETSPESLPGRTRTPGERPGEESACPLAAGLLVLCAHKSYGVLLRLSLRRSQLYSSGITSRPPFRGSDHAPCHLSHRGEGQLVISDGGSQVDLTDPGGDSEAPWETERSVSCSCFTPRRREVVHPKQAEGVLE